MAKRLEEKNAKRAARGEPPLDTLDEEGDPIGPSKDNESLLMILKYSKRIFVILKAALKLPLKSFFWNFFVESCPKISPTIDNYFVMGNKYL